MTCQGERGLEERDYGREGAGAPNKKVSQYRTLVNRQ